MSDTRPQNLILIASALLLFSELMMIRVQSSYVHLFGFFKNISLLSCFLGMGIGLSVKSLPKRWLAIMVTGLPLQVAPLYSMRFTSMSGLENPFAGVALMGQGTWESYGSLLISALVVALIFMQHLGAYNLTYISRIMLLGSPYVTTSLELWQIKLHQVFQRWMNKAFKY